VNLQFAVNKAHVVVFAGNPESLGKFARPVAEVFEFHGLASFSHKRDAFNRLQGADQHGLAFADFAGNYVQAMVHSVNEIHIGTSGGPKHRRVAGSLAAVCMAAGIVMVQVSLGLDNFAF